MGVAACYTERSNEVIKIRLLKEMVNLNTLKKTLNNTAEYDKQIKILQKKIENITIQIELERAAHAIEDIERR